MTADDASATAPRMQSLTLPDDRRIRLFASGPFDADALDSDPDALPRNPSSLGR